MKLIQYSLLLLLYFACGTIKAQTYNTTLGVRLDKWMGVTVQQNVFSSNITLEAIAQTNFNDSYLVTGLLEQHHNLLGKRLNYYYGIGPHMLWEPRTPTGKGISFVIGAEITLLGLNVSWDWKPVYNIVGGSKQLMHGTALSIRKVILKRNKRNRGWPFGKR